MTTSAHKTALSKHTKNECFYPLVFTGKKDSPSTCPKSEGLFGSRLTSPQDLLTRYYNFGARYYDSDLSGLFLSVDPMADKYPSISPYAYCAWNPVKLVDPNGDTIKNAYENYKNVTNEIEYYRSLINNSTDQKAITQYDSEITKLKTNNNNYHKIDKLLQSFKNQNSDEFDIINNLEYNGVPVNIFVSLSDMKSDPRNGAVAETNIPYVVDNNNNVQGIEQPGVIIKLFKNGFADGFNGLGTLANEFGDVVFGVAKAQYNYDTFKTLNYKDRPTTKFSYDYERYIISPHSSARPNPHSY